MWRDEETESHKSFESPRQIRCFKCNTIGHRANDCPTNRQNANHGYEDRFDSNSTDSGHLRTHRNYTQLVCMNCNQPGHESSECRQEQNNPPSNQCNLCKGFGHSADVCANRLNQVNEGLSRMNEGLSRMNIRPSFGRGGGIRNEHANVNGRHNDSGNNNNGKSDELKIREIYIPPEKNEADLNEIRQKIGVNFKNYKDVKTTMTGEQIPYKLIGFDEANIHDIIRDNMAQIGYETPTPIQTCSLPAISAERDIMACATTGSGKTAAFLIPILTLILQEEGILKNGLCSTPEPLVLIISPTKELAIQIYEDVRILSRNTAIRASLVYGGVSVGYQASELRRNGHIVIATPGRLLHFLREEKLSVEKLKFLVLDEADTMLNMNFMSDIKSIVQQHHMNTERQTLMFSATFPDTIQKLAQEFLKRDYLHITVGILGGASEDITQTIININYKEKMDKLKELLDEFGDVKVLVFVATKRMADFLASMLSQKNYRATTIHGDRLQREREEALNSFKSNECNILIATDVLARGHDIKDLEHVVVYDMPEDMDTYIHRIGRTGRLGNIGKSYCFFTPDKDKDKARTLVKIMSEAMQSIPNWLEEMASDPYNRQHEDHDGKGMSYGNHGYSQHQDVADEDDNWD